MPRPKKKSAALNTGELRLSGMKKIDPKLDLGGGCTTTALEAKVKDVRKILAEYNDMLTDLDLTANKLERAEKALNHLSKKVLTGVATRYDKESDQYEAVGGVKPSDRKRPNRQPKGAVAV